MMLRSREQDGNAPARRQSAFEALFQPAFPELALARGLMSALTPVMAEAAQFVPSVELSERDGNYVVDVALPGFRKEDIDIEITGNEVTISGRYERKREDAKTHYTEMQQASFSRTVVLPQEIDAERVAAEFQDGILRITAPPVTKLASRKVPIAGSRSQNGNGAQPSASQQRGAQGTSQTGASQSTAGQSAGRT